MKCTCAQSANHSAEKSVVHIRMYTYKLCIARWLLSCFFVLYNKRLGGNHSIYSFVSLYGIVTGIRNLINLIPLLHSSITIMVIAINGRSN